LKRLVAQLKTIHDERQPDVALFGESLCPVQPYQFLAAEATIATHSGAHFVAAFTEEPAETQPWYDRIIAKSVLKDPTPEQRRFAEVLEEKMIDANVEGTATDCPSGVAHIRAAADVALGRVLINRGTPFDVRYVPDRRRESRHRGTSALCHKPTSLKRAETNTSVGAHPRD
jgi:hypothetical protein